MNKYERVGRALELAEKHNIPVKINIKDMPKGCPIALFSMKITGKKEAEKEIFDALRMAGYIPKGLKIKLDKNDNIYCEMGKL